MPKQPDNRAAGLLREVGLALYGEEWRDRLAVALGVQRETIRTWARGGDARFGPDHPAIKDLLALVERRAEETVRARDALRAWLGRSHG
jgi:hypothetical protein